MLFKKLLPTALMASLACSAAFGSNNLQLTDEQAAVANALAVAARQQVLATQNGVSLAFVEAVEEVNYASSEIDKPRLRVLMMINDRRELPRHLPNLVLQHLAQYLPKPIVDWTNQESIERAFAPFDEAEKAISQCTYEWLYVNNLPLSVLPTLTRLTQLKTLYLSYNQLRALPEGFSALTLLKALSLDGNQLKELPANFSALTGLTTLNLNGNKLKELPAGFSALKGLKALSLDGNQLTALPAGFSKLTVLRVLYLNNNQLMSLPEGFSELTNLWCLHLHNNKLKALPEGFSELRELGVLQLDPAIIAQLSPQHKASAKHY